MLRKTFVIIPIILLALAGCSSKSKDATVSGAAPSAGAPAAPAATPTGLQATPQACPTARTRKLTKTRFIANAGLAAGAFKRYIYDPYRQGSFKSGAPGHKRAIVKAAAAGLFTLDQLRRARANVQADPTLCKALSAPMRRLGAAMTSMVDKLKKGQVDPTSIGSASGALEQTRGAAGSAGAGFKDRNVPGNMIGG